MSEAEEKTGEIKVADVSIAHLSRGLYRSTAAAFKELVNNAWDADAEEVRLDTNFPQFDYISCVDNGPGMSEEQFLNYFAYRGIGYGDKRKGHRNVTEKYRRPIIGRLGIGMLAIGQLCYSFEIESHYVNKDGVGLAYKADIDLLDLDVPDIDESLSSDEMEPIKVGNWRLNRINYDKSRQGFRIFTSDVRETYRKEMETSITKEDRKNMSFSLDKLHERFYNRVTRSIREKKAYLEAIWELCMLCPIPYEKNELMPLDLGAFDSRYKDEEYKKAVELIEIKQKELNSYNFRVVFDGIELKRYFKLPRERDTIPRVFFIEADEIIADRKLKYHGYVFGQTKAIRPYELSGVQIRLRNVGIGGYDNTFLKYDKKIETIRNRWVSGEIFVEDGLEVALNIDRDSFNEHDEHYKKIQEDLHNSLDTIFSRIENTAEGKRKEKRERQESSDREVVWGILNKFGEGNIEILEEDLGEEESLLKYDEKERKVFVNTAFKTVRRKAADNLIKLIMLAYYISMHISRDEDERYDNFYRIMKEIINRIV